MRGRRPRYRLRELDSLSIPQVTTGAAVAYEVIRAGVVHVLPLLYATHPLRFAFFFFFFFFFPCSRPTPEGKTRESDISVVFNTWKYSGVQQ